MTAHPDQRPYEYIMRIEAKKRGVWSFMGVVATV